VQPTDHCVRSVFVFLEHESREEERACFQIRASRAGRENPMKLRLIRIALALGTVASMAIAGGASVKGW